MKKVEPKKIQPIKPQPYDPKAYAALQVEKDPIDREIAERSAAALECMCAAINRVADALFLIAKGPQAPKATEIEVTETDIPRTEP